jgi:hypothetical protein
MGHSVRSCQGTPRLHDRLMQHPIPQSGAFMRQGAGFSKAAWEIKQLQIG